MGTFKTVKLELTDLKEWKLINVLEDMCNEQKNSKAENPLELQNRLKHSDYLNAAGKLLVGKLRSFLSALHQHKC